MMAELVRVRIDDLGDPGIDVAARRPGAARSRRIGQPLAQSEVGALVETIDPVIDRPAADAEGLGDLLDGVALAEPQQRLGPGAFPAYGRAGGEELEVRSLTGREREQSHRSTLRKGDGVRGLIVTVQKVLATYLSDLVSVEWIALRAGASSGGPEPG